MPNDMRAAYQTLVDRILRGPGETTPQQRAEAFEDPGADPLLSKVATRPADVTDADFDRPGLSADQLFELVIAAAAGEATRRYDAALAALDEASR